MSKVAVLRTTPETVVEDYGRLMDLAGYQLEEVTNTRDALDIISRQKALNFNPGEECSTAIRGISLPRKLLNGCQECRCGRLHRRVFSVLWG